jgi:ferredoxin
VKYSTATSFFDDSEFLPYKIKKFNRKFVIGKPNVIRDKCDKCGLCEQICKFDALKLKPYPCFDRNKCIRCYGCYEVCPKDAIFIEKNIIARQILKLREAVLSVK